MKRFGWLLDIVGIIVVAIIICAIYYAFNVGMTRGTWTRGLNAWWTYIRDPFVVVNVGIGIASALIWPKVKSLF